MTNLIGEFDLSISNLQKADFQGSFIIAKRRKPTPKKPLLYLLYKSQTGNITYISSLYPEGKEEAKNGLEIYSFDMDGEFYYLDLDRGKNKARITPRFTANAINNAVKGVKITPILDFQLSKL